MDEATLRRRRLIANGLSGRGIGGDVAATAKRLVGLQGQERRAAELAWQPRSREVTRADVVKALDAPAAAEVGPRLVRTWLMRGALHVAAADDAAWLLHLLGPLFVAKGQRRRDQLGLNEKICLRAMAILRERLQGATALTRQELAAALSAEQVPVEGQSLYHLLYRAGLERVICLGAERNGEQTFVLAEEWIRIEAAAGETKPKDAAVRLARRYLAGYGPARAEDFSAWSGLGVRQARPAIEAAGRLLPGSSELFFESREPMAEEAAMEGVEARLLPAYDSFLLAYSQRTLVAPQFAREIHPGGGVIKPTLLLNGVAAGTWRMQEGKVVLSLFEPLDAHKERAAEQAAAEMEAYVAGQ